MVYLITLTLFLFYAHVQYTPHLRERWLWLVAPALGLVSHSVWAWWCKSLGNERAIFIGGFWYWQVCVTAIPFMILPPILYGVRLSPIAWVGLVLAVVGCTLIYFGKSG